MVDIIRGRNYCLVVGSPSQFGLYARPFPNEPQVFHPFRLNEIASQFDAVIDGPMYDTLDNPLGYSGIQIYESYTRGKMLANVYDPRFNVDFRGDSDWSRNGASISLVGNQLITLEHQERARNCTVSVQLRPFLVLNSELVFTDTQRSRVIDWRAGAGVLRDGNLGFLGWEEGIEWGGRFALNHGFVNFGYTDGGGSTSIWANGQHVFGPRFQRRIGSALVMTKQFLGGGSNGGSSNIISSTSGTSLFNLGLLGLGLYGVYRIIRR